MLKLWLYEPRDGSKYTYSAEMIFDALHKPEWMVEPTVKEMIRDIDQSEVIDKELIRSPVLGMIPPMYIAGGTKTLIMAMHDDTRIYNLTSCGNNCAKWAVRIAEDRDITMCLGYYMDFEDAEPFEIEILNTGNIVRTQREFEDEMIVASIIHFAEVQSSEG